jgi:nucleoside-diphosphate-sugar epimerase
MKILVTGASGFIGNHIILDLLKRKAEVIATDIETSMAESKEWFGEVQFVEHRIDEKVSEENLFEKFHRPDLLIHLAWKGLPNYKDLFHFEENLPQQYLFLKNLLGNGLKDLLVSGTCLEYGMKSGCLSEDIVGEPANPYALAKDSLRKFLTELQKKNPFILKWARLFYMYGKGQNPNALLAQLDKALENNEKSFNMSNGDQKRDYLPVEIMANYVCRIALQTEVTGVINCCSGKPVTLLSLIEEHIKRSGKKIRLNKGYYPYPDYEPMEFWGDARKLQIALNISE